MKHKDTIQKFLFENAPIRGEIVNLDNSWQQIVQRHEFPEQLMHDLGEMTAASALLASTLKFKGSLIMQLQDAGPVQLMVAECTSEHNIRATAKWDLASFETEFGKVFDNSRLVITIDPRNSGERYQGIVQPEGNSIAEAIQQYLAQSEQLPTHLWLAASREKAAGLMLQRMPGHLGSDQDLWERVVHLASTITNEELLTLAPEEILRRLFHEEVVRLFEPEMMAFSCSCSRERVARTLTMLGQQEVESILSEHSEIEVRCEFCSQLYTFDSIDAARLFAENPEQLANTTRH